MMSENEPFDLGWVRALRTRFGAEGLALISEAAEFAWRCHSGQKRKWTGQDSFVHPERVAAAAAGLEGSTAELVAGGFLHDGPEDCGGLKVLREIRRRFGDEVYHIVRGMTKPSKVHRIEGGREAKLQVDLDHYWEQPPTVKRLKMLDRIDNLRDMGGAPAALRRRYGEESLRLAAVLFDADPELHAELVRLAKAIASGEEVS